MPEKHKVPVVKAGDVTQRVGVEVISARGVDVEVGLLLTVGQAPRGGLWSLLRLYLATAY